MERASGLPGLLHHYERWLDARYAAARGHCDGVIDPVESRRYLAFALEACEARRP